MMKLTLDPANPETWPKGRINAERLDATTESELAAQQASDDESAEQDSAKTVPADRPNITGLIAYINLCSKIVIARLRIFGRRRKFIVQTDLAIRDIL